MDKLKLALDAETDNRVDLSLPIATSLEEDLCRHFHYTLGRDNVGSSKHYLYQALALTIRDKLVACCRQTRKKRQRNEQKKVAYFSLEFLMGRALGNAVLNLELQSDVTSALARYSSTLEEVAMAEHDAGLGNGGLGRLAACMLDSCATMGLPVTGYGIRYEYGAFKQCIENGYQVESPDNWLRDGHPWEIEAPEHSRRIKFFGRVHCYTDAQGVTHRQWLSTQDVLAVPYDIPIPGYKNQVVNTLRLWSASGTDDFDLEEFNAGSYIEAVAYKNRAEQITMVLYPNDASENGKELRLRQQYFLCSASLQDILASWQGEHAGDFSQFAAQHVFQLNDTHPSIAIAELMRLLIDEYQHDWDRAWSITKNVMAYTNHTLLPEALEKWTVRLFARLLPRLLEIIYEINARFLQQVACKWPGDKDKQRQMSLIEEGPEPQVRMAYLAIVGSFSVNGVAALHTHLLSSGLFNDFYQLWPEKFNNITNGVTPRRWLGHCNPELEQLIASKLGQQWISDFSRVRELASFSEDADFQHRWQEVKNNNKNKLIDFVAQHCNVKFEQQMLFDVQVKRIHEYKRQLLNVLHVIHLYQRILANETENFTPRAILFAGKAAPGYPTAKLIIKLINNVATTINADPCTKGLLRVAFLADYNVTAMEVICPATDLSEQISTTGKEASGTGNMKLMMNGAVTIGTLDGANIEIRQAVGAENFYLFGPKSEELEDVYQNYNPGKIIEQSPALKAVLELLRSGYFNFLEGPLFTPLLEQIYSPNDQWLTAFDFDSYLQAQHRVEEAWRDKAGWTRCSILNTAASGWFSSDRTIDEYCQRIWRV